MHSFKFFFFYDVSVFPYTGVYLKVAIRISFLLLAKLEIN